MVAVGREAQRLEVLLLNESYAMLIPGDQDVFVGMRARKTVRMCPSSCHTCDVGWRAQDDDGDDVVAVVAQQACIVAGDGGGGL